MAKVKSPADTNKNAKSIVDMDTAAPDIKNAAAASGHKGGLKVVRRVLKY